MKIPVAIFLKSFSVSPRNPNWTGTHPRRGKRRPRFISRRRVYNPRPFHNRPIQVHNTVFAWEADSQPGNPGRQSYRDNVPLEQESRLRIRVTRSGYADRVPPLRRATGPRFTVLMACCASSKRLIERLIIDVSRDRVESSRWNAG